jgi:serine/threonine protein kinase
MPTSSGNDASLGAVPRDWPQTKAVLTEAIKLPQGERRRFIAAACLHNPQLRDELLSILDNYDTAERVCAPALTGGVVPGIATPAQKKGEPVLIPGATYGSYRVLKQLGAGGMGQVFLALDVRLDRRVALKSLAGHWLESPTARQRLMREARSAAALTHPNIATLYDVLEEPSHLLLVMEYVEGRSASSLLDHGPVPLGHALRLAIQIADAVSYAHDRGIIHCDIKPANVQVAVDGAAKVLDFGLARARFDVGDADSATSDQGRLLGTLGYMAPERIVEGTLNASGDIYSLGVVIFEMVTARRFFDGRDLPAFLLTVLGSHVPKPSSLVSGVPIAVDEIVERALAKKPALRYQSARELRRDLEKVLASLEGSASPWVIDRSDRHTEYDARTQWKHRALVVAAAVGAVAMVLTVAGFATSTFYNLAFGITPDFDSGSALDWPLWGLRSLMAPIVLFGAFAAAAIVSLKGLYQMTLSLKPLRRWREPLSFKARQVTSLVRSSAAQTLAQILLVMHCAVLGLNFWWFSDFMGALESLFVQTNPANLAELAPGNRAEHNLFRQLLSLELWTFGLAWYALLKLRLERHERRMDMSIVGGLALLILTLFVLVAPYRIVRHNEHEQVVYGQDICYFFGQRGNEALLFCPAQDPPRNRIVRLDDPKLERGGPEENVFSRLAVVR